MKDEKSGRILISETSKHVGQEILIKGWVKTRRDHGKLIFLDVRDRSGIVQIVVNPHVSEEAYEQGQKLRSEFVLEIFGKVNKRPEKLINPKLSTGTIEIEAQKITIFSAADVLPFDLDQPELNLELPTLLDYRAVSLRHPKVQSIFKIQEAVMEGFRQASQALGCTEIFVPTISYSSTEGGAEVFRVDYYDHKAFLIQSPQLYKQMMVPVFERVYLTSHAYRAEPSITTRHLSESTQLDCELGFVAFEDLLDAVAFVGRKTLEYVSETHADILADYGISAPKLPEKTPRFTMREAQEIIYERTKRDSRKEQDLAPEDEREIAAYAREKFGSDLVTITHYPTKKRAFYTQPDPENPAYSLSYDLLFRGIEVLSGSKRINDYEALKKVIAERGMDTANFGMYLQAFKYGMPPHGGFSFGLERMTMKLLNLGNIREASLFPRDMERIDERLSIHTKVSNTKK